jgi:adenosylmethionine-8-amino-7-oxononanoate aminotransferase
VAGFNNVVTLAPPLIVDEDDVEFIAHALTAAVSDL